MVGTPPASAVGGCQYRLKDDKIAEIVSIFPDKNVENATDGISAALQQHLAKPGVSGSKYVIVDKVTGDEYATFDPTQARQFSQALGSDGESRQLDPDAPGFDRQRKSIPLGIEVGYEL
jgi:hypothetical protein